MGRFDDILGAGPQTPNQGSGRFDDILGTVPQAPTTQTPSIFSHLWKGMSTNEPTQGAAETIGRAALPAVFGTAGAIAGGPTAPLTGPIAGGAGEAVRQALVSATNPDRPMGLKDAAQTAAAPVVEGGAQYLGGKALEGAAALGKGVFNLGAKTITGLSPATLERIAERPMEATSAAARAPEAAQDMAAKFKQAILDHFDAAKTQYQSIKDALLTSPKYAGKTLDVAAEMETPINQIGKKYGLGMSNSGRLANKLAPADAQAFQTVSDHIRGLGDASTESVYYLQRDLGGLVEAQRLPHGGLTPLGGALNELDEHLNGVLGKNIPEIGKANEVFSSAAQLRDTALGKGSVRGTGNLLEANDLPQKVLTAYAKKTTTRDALEHIADNIPAAREALEGMRDAAAGAQTSPLVASIPRTGLAAGLGYGAAHVGMGPHQAVVLANFLSPRLVGNELALGARVAANPIAQGAAQALKASLGAAAEPAPQSIPVPVPAGAPATPPAVAAPDLATRNAIKSIILAQGGLNPKKAGGDGLAELGLPSNLVSKSGRSSVGVLAKILADKGLIPEEDEGITMQHLRALAQK